MNDDFEGVNERAIKWYEKGGIVTICWHCGSDFSGEWKDAMEDTVADWDKMLTVGTEEYESMIAGMDKAAAALKALSDKGIPVLWRPFHELDGTWFWWGKCTPEQFVAMWRIMYERYTDYWKLNNLIWVLGFSDQGTDSEERYVGDEYCDIVSADYYPTAHQHTSMKTQLDSLKEVTPNKPYAIGEIGTVPDIAAVEAEETDWLWFMMWSKDFVLADTYNTAEEFRKQFNAKYAITLDKLPKMC
jgi:beta-mannanase